MKLLNFTLWLLVSFLSTSFAESKPKNAIRLAIVGDSTVKDYVEASPVQGWGKFAGSYLNETTIVANHASGGASSRSFMASEKWQKTLDEHPDYIVIQFGHNDALNDGDPRATVAATEFTDFIRTYIRETKAVNATPILVTPMAMRTYGRNGKLKEKLAPYANAMKAVAKEENVLVVDLHSASCRLYETLGRQSVSKFAAAPTDSVHFNALGARAMAKLVMTDLLEKYPELRRPVKPKLQASKRHGIP